MVPLVALLQLHSFELSQPDATWHLLLPSSSAAIGERDQKHCSSPAVFSKQVAGRV